MNYKDSLNLPKTAFPMRASLPKREPLWQECWEKYDVYADLKRAREGAEEFILHDGPPFANGDAHMGHALNMTLKDIVLKSRNMAGLKVPFIPGWDCHGLPIEHKVMKELGKSADEMPEPLEVRKHCREMAEKYIDIQREQFKRLGVFGEWEDPYITMEPEYEADVLRVFGTMVEKGLVFQALKPVYWSTGCQTALAEAEVEYMDKDDTAVFVSFPLKPSGLKALGLDQASLAIWTTTPWTLPANLAVAIHERLEYAVVENAGERLIVAVERVEGLYQVTQRDWQVKQTLFGKDLLGFEYSHPFLEDQRARRVFHGDFVTVESGTGLVHIAPGHGNDDYVLGQREGLDVLSPVDDRGCLTAECGVPDLVGQYVFKANPKIIDLLEAKGRLVAKEFFQHSYPHCWRSKAPIVFRSVTQWFIRVDDFRQQALDAIGGVKWIPAWGENRIRGAVESRPDWCISRQRTWGIPIPAFFDESGKAQLDAGTVWKFADLVEKEGTDIWFRESDGDLCGKLGLPEKWKKGFDTLDVWIDSGSSHAAVTRKRLKFPADLYLEGSDQHRGWFQSSLSTSVATTGEAPYRAVLTNGFVVDLDGKKLSKSNSYEKPTDLMSFVSRYGADILRLWVSHEDYRNDVPFSEEIFKRVSDTYRSMRNTFRILLANLKDFDPEKDLIAFTDLTGMDRAVDLQLQNLIRQVREAYETYEFHQVYHLINRFCAVELSALYIDVTKDRMYCDPIDSKRRRATQTVMHEVLDALCLLLAPIMAFTCEEVWQYAGAAAEAEEEAEGKLLRTSVHLQAFPQARQDTGSSDFLESWEGFLKIREQVNELLEGLRRDKVIGKSLEAVVTLPRNQQNGMSAEDLAEIFIVSAVQFEESDAIRVESAEALGWKKCVRCWSFHPPENMGSNPEHPELCPRCTSAVTGS